MGPLRAAPPSPLPYGLDWPQWPDYQVDTDGWICPIGKRRDSRRLTSDVDLVNPFVRIASSRSKEERVQALLAFVREFGLLGHTVLGKPTQSDEWPPTVLPPARKHKTGRFDVLSPEADQIEWALLHARNVDRIVRLHSSRLDDLDELLAQLESRSVRVRGISKNVEEPWTAVRYPVALAIPRLEAPWKVHVRDLGLRVSGDDPMRVRRRIIGHCLNPNIGGVRREYDPKTGTPVWRFRALLELLYWQLADRLDHYPIRQCRCGTMFFALHGRQESCIPKCFRRFYMREHRKGDLRRSAHRKIKRTTKKGPTS